MNNVIEFINKMDALKKVAQSKSRFKRLPDIEKKFSLILPKSYKKYIFELDFAPTELDHINFTNQYKQNLDLEYINNKLRNELITFPLLPNYLFAISDGHDDDYICFDLREAKDSEYPLCNWSVHSPYYKDELMSKYPSGPEEQANCYTIAESFCAFIKSKLTFG